MRGVTRSDLVRIVLRRQSLQSELADRLQHPEANASQPTVRRRLLPLKQTAVDEKGDTVENVRGNRRQGTGNGRRPSSCSLFPVPGSPADGFRRVEGEAAGEDREAAEQRLLVGREEVVAPGDGVAHRLEARRHVTRAAGKQREAAL